MQRKHGKIEVVLINRPVPLVKKPDLDIDHDFRKFLPPPR